MPVVLKFVQYRLSRVYQGGNQDYITYNKVVLFVPQLDNVSTYFVEGFGAVEFLVEAARGVQSFRKQTLVSQMLYDFDHFDVIGDEVQVPQIRSRLSIAPAPAGFDVDEAGVFSVKFRDIDASWGSTIEAYNATALGANTNIKFFDRSVRSVNRQRNILETRSMLTPTPPPEKVAEPLLEIVEAGV